MGFNANKVETLQGEMPRGVLPTSSETQLTKQEIEVLLNLIKNSNFNGSVLELLYNLVIKLQKQYKNQE